MSHSVADDRIAQRLDNMLLSDNFIPLLGAPLVVQSFSHDQIQY
jgi:hypothetical protein